MAVGGCKGEDPARLALEQDAADLELEARAGEPGGEPASGGAAATPTESGQAQPSTGGEAPPRPNRRNLVIPIGTTFEIRLNETLSTDQSRVGDPFTATLADPIVDLRGEVLLPTGAVVRGRITGAHWTDQPGDTAIITLAFESVSFAGRSYPFQATVVEASPERRTRAASVEEAAEDSGATTWGRVLGKSFRTTEDGAVVGAAVGTAIALGTTGLDVVLPSGSKMMIRLDAPVEVGR